MCFRSREGEGSDCRSLSISPCCFITVVVVVVVGAEAAVVAASSSDMLVGESWGWDMMISCW